jgi:ATP-dependent protease ClpP protease subunit
MSVTRTSNRDTDNAGTRAADTRTAELKRAPVLVRDTQAAIAKISQRLDAPIICYWISVNGSICHNDVVAMNELLKGMKKERKLYIFIKSDGGTGQVALRLVNLLRRKCDRLVALVPLNCESAATMLALGADEIQMGPMAFLTAVDTSIVHDMSPIDRDNDRVRVGTNELQRILALWAGEKKQAGGKDRGAPVKNPYEEIYRYIHPLVIGAVDRAGSLATMLCTQILSYHIKNAALRQRIAHRLNNDYPSHSYPIVLREAQQIGLHAKELAPDLEHQLMELNEIYSEMGQRFRTDHDEFNHHDNEIVNILETSGTQIYFQVDKDWHFRQSDRTWVFTNEKSHWHVWRNVDGKMVDDQLHIR